MEIGEEVISQRLSEEIFSRHVGRERSKCAHTADRFRKVRAENKYWIWTCKVPKLKRAVSVKL